jgi:rsbT co-antagonist protein RsbR
LAGIVLPQMSAAGLCVALLDAARAVKLLGTQTILVGLRPELAQTIIGLGLDLTGLSTQADLQSGVSYAMRKRGGAATSLRG